MKKLIALLTVACLLLTAVPAALAETCIGTAEGRNGDVTVEVEYTDGKIVSVNVTAHQETPGIADPAIEQVPARIVEQQSLAVDGVSGATLTSNAIKNAAEAALVAGGVDAEALKVAQAKEKTVREAEETDVVIIGAGMAGLCAARELQNNHPGVRFIVVEKLDVITGSLPFTGGAIFAPTSTVQNEENSFAVEDIVEMFRTTSGTDINEALVSNIYEGAADLLNELLEAGYPAGPYITLSSPYYNDKVYTLWAEGGGNAFAVFMKDFVARNPFDLRTGTKAESLIVEDGAVAGVSVSTADEVYDIRAKAVLLATGGFGSNKELMTELLPAYLIANPATNGGASGDAFAMVEQFGTKLVGTGTMGTPYGTTDQSTFFVNLNGERFISELVQGYAMQRAIAEQPEGIVYCLIDNDHLTVNDAVQAKLDNGSLKKYDTLEALAADLGVNAENLLKTVEAYNAAADAGEAIPSKEDELPNELAKTLKTAPFYAEQMPIYFFGTIPGLEVNENCQILDADGNPVSGLWAAGELIAGNAFTREYPGSGTGISFASNSGRFAAEQIADAIQ